MNFKRIVFLLLLVGLFGFDWPFSWLFSASNPEQIGSNAWLQREMQILRSQASNLDSHILRLSLIAYMNAHKKGYVSKPLLTVIDYSKPSSEKRMWVFDMKSGRKLFHTYVSHGRNSGGAVANSFSNSRGSLKSSLGTFVTDAYPYMGGNGYSLRLRGLEHGINDNAYNRNVVMHGAWYVNPDIIKKRGQLGRSWGCPAVSAELAKPIIDTIKQRSLVFVYYPDRNWLRHSKFLSA